MLPYILWLFEFLRQIVMDLKIFKRRVCVRYAAVALLSACLLTSVKRQIAYDNCADADASVGGSKCRDRGLLLDADGDAEEHDQPK